MSAQPEKKIKKKWPFKVLAVLIKSIYFETEAVESIGLNKACERFYAECGEVLQKRFSLADCVLRSYNLLTSKEVLDKELQLDTSQKAMMLFKLNLPPDLDVLERMLNEVTDQKCINWLVEMKEKQMKNKSQVGPSSSNNVGLSTKRKRQRSADERQAKERRQSPDDNHQTPSSAEDGANSCYADGDFVEDTSGNAMRKLGKKDEDFEKVVQDVSSRKRQSGQLSVERCVDFFLYLERCHKKKEYNNVHVSDEVELSLRFFKKSSSELNTFQTKRSVLKHKEVRLTVMLTAKSNGSKHLPYILIREGEGQKRAMKVEVPRCQELFSEKLTLASTSLPHFTPEGMVTFLGSRSGPDRAYINRNMLIWDSNIAHNHETVRKFLDTRKTDVVCFPEEENNTLQIADLYWKPKLLEGIRNNYKQWWIEKGHLQTEPPSMEDYLPWIVDAWNSITRQEIVDSFAACGLDIGRGGIDPSKIRCFNEGGALENHVGLLDSRRKLRAQNKEDFEDYATISNVDLSFVREAEADRPDLLQAVKDVSREKKCFLRIGVIECIDFLVTLEHMMLKKRFQQILACNEMDLCFSFQKKAPLWQKKPMYNKVFMTVLLAAKSDGSKCRPHVVLQSKKKLIGKEWRKFEKMKNEFKARMEVTAKTEPSIDYSDLKKILPSLLGRTQTRTLVVWDSRSSHRELTRFLKSRRVDSILVPEDAVEVLQASNIYWKPSFISNLRQSFENWRANSADPTPDVPANDVLASWIADAWENIPFNRIQQSFVGTGLSGWRGQLDANRLHCFGENKKLADHRSLLEKRRAILATHMNIFQVEEEESEEEEDVEEEVEMERAEGSDEEEDQEERAEGEEIEEEEVEDFDFDPFHANAAAIHGEGNARDARPPIREVDGIEEQEEEEEEEGEEEEEEGNHEIRLGRMEGEGEEEELGEGGAEGTDKEEEFEGEDEQAEEPAPTENQPQNPELQKPIKAHLILRALRECATRMSPLLFDEFLKTVERQRYLTDPNKTVALEILVDSVESIESRLVGNKTQRGDETDSVSLSVALAGFESFLLVLNEKAFKEHLARIQKLKAKFQDEEYNVLFEKLVFFFSHIFDSACL